jgi:ribosomal protein S24E
MEKKNLKAKIRKVLEKEGGAAGMKALKKQTGSSEKDIKSAIANDEKVAQHPDKDYILAKGKIQISEDELVDMIQEELKVVLDETQKAQKKKEEKIIGQKGCMLSQGEKPLCSLAIGLCFRCFG